MNEQKSLFLEIAEAVDRHLPRHKANDRVIASRSGGLARLLRWFLPNGGTLLLVAALILTQQVWAKPLLSPASAPGPSATTVNYQGRLANSSGKPLDGSYGMTFALWSAPSDGSLVWGPESHAAVPVSEGLFSVGLGSQTAGGIPTSVWDGDRYLEITVGGETLSPRELIRSVPIAGMALTVPDRAVASRHARLTSGRITATNDLNLTTSPQTIPGMSTTVSPDTNQTYIFYLVTEFADYASTPGFGYAELLVDGVAANGGQVALMGWSAQLSTVAQVYRVNLTAGTHTVEAQATSSQGGGQLSRWQTSLTWFAVSQ